MGYTTDFTGTFKLDKPLSVAQLRYLQAFSETRRMARTAHVTETMPDPARLAVGLPVGPHGAYYVGAAGDDFDQAHSADVLEYNSPPEGQPGLWCQWVPTEDGTGIQWNGAERFYSYVEWLEYIVNHFLKPWDLVLSGEVEWSGEERGDVGKIVVTDNRVRALKGKITY